MAKREKKQRHGPAKHIVRRVPIGLTENILTLKERLKTMRKRTKNYCGFDSDLMREAMSVGFQLLIRDEEKILEKA